MGRPPSFIARRAIQELRTEAERFLAPRRASRFGGAELLRRLDARSMEELWTRLAARAYATPGGTIDPVLYDAICPGDRARILAAAENALAHRVDMLGSGVVELGAEIDWHRDFKSGHRWEPAYCRDIDYMDAGRNSDVKVPWELSRMQWLIPAGQAYLMGGDERFAQGARLVLENWIDQNPVAGSVNWSIAMEAAMRIIVWTWFFHAFAAAPSWRDEGFRGRFLCSLYLHADFTARFFEFSDVNGNHCDSDATGLVFAGLFFGGRGEAQRWLELGWDVLETEIDRQVSEDGVDFEGSVPYHRLVTELFLLPALYRLRHGLTVSREYRERVRKMALFVDAYSRPDGSAPVWGDADDGRVLPFGGQPLNDHQYLVGCVGHAFEDQGLLARARGDRAEFFWLLGADAVRSLPAHPVSPPHSKIFRSGGYAVLRNERDHVFVDCAPVGMGGRGGHGHNDVLSFELFLDGHHLVSDCGAYVYTSDYEARNRFRSTAYHNTPRIDGEEVNRFVGREELWWLRDDARPAIRRHEPADEADVLVVAHTGYLRLTNPVTPVRTYILEHSAHALIIVDQFEGEGSHAIEVPVHLANGVEPEMATDGVRLRAGDSVFSVQTLSPGWTLTRESTELSASYGRRKAGHRLVWRREGPLVELRVRFGVGDHRP